MKKIQMFLILGFLCLPFSAAVLGITSPFEMKPIYPGRTWERRVPGSFGLDTTILTKITSLMEKAHSNGVLIKDGYLVKEWNYDGPSNKKIEVQSVSKSITGLMLGLAIKDGKIPSVDVSVKRYYPEFQAGIYTDQITFEHLVTATSGMASVQNKERYLDPGNKPPGLSSHYHNDHTAQLAKALTYLYGESILEVLRRSVLNKIGAQMEWGTHGTVVAANGKTVPVVAGYAYNHWTAGDLARVGWLYLNKGKWKGEQLVPASFVKHTLTPLRVPVYNFRSTNKAEVMDRSKTYGYAWWGQYTPSGKNLIWYMSGNGGQFCIIIPEAGLVFTKINGIGADYQPFIGYTEFENDLLALVKMN